MKGHSITHERKVPLVLQWVMKFLLTLPGCIALAGGINAVQRVAQSFGGSMNFTSVMDNWLVWFAVSFFIAGLSITNWLEFTLLQRQFNLSRILAVSFLLGVMILFLAWDSLSMSPTFQRLDDVFLPFIMSGFFLRYSMFRNQSFLLMQSAFFGERQKAGSSKNA